MLATNELSINGLTELDSNEMAEIDGGLALLTGALIVAGSIVVAGAVGAAAGYIYGKVTS